jgi:cell division inhibitor SepF
MSIFDKFANSIGISPSEDEKRLAEEEARLEEQERQQREAAQAAARKGAQENIMDNVVNLHHPSQGAAKDNIVAAYKVKVIVIEPQSFDDAQQVANCLREKKPVVINFEKTNGDEAKRIIDFISGTTYALNGEIKKVGHNVFLCAPSNVNVTYTENERSKSSSEMPWTVNKN